MIYEAVTFNDLKTVRTAFQIIDEFDNSLINSKGFHISVMNSVGQSYVWKRFSQENFLLNIAYNLIETNRFHDVSTGVEF